MLVKTGYGTGPYRIKHIVRGCTCPCSLDKFNMQTPPPSPPHVHMILSDPDGRGEFYLGWYDEDTLQSVARSYDGSDEDCAIPASKDVLIILPDDRPVQTTLF